MKVIVKQETIIKALNVVLKAVSPTSTMEITKGILLKTSGDMQIVLSATDIQLAITTTADAIVNEYGGVVVSARLFTDLVRKLPSGDILISTDEKHVVSIKTEKSEYELQGKDESEFPRVESEEEGKKIKIEKGLLQDMIEGVCFSASTDESRGIITGVLFEMNEGALSTVALDGYRVAVKREKREAFEGEDFKIVIPAKNLREAGKILSDVGGSDEEEVVFEIGENWVRLYPEGTTIRINLLQGEFIKYRDVIPKDNRIALKVDKNELQSAVERAAMIKSDGKNSFVRLSIAEDVVRVSSRGLEGKGQETVAAEKTGEDLEIGFDAKFLIDALKAAEDDVIEMNFNTGVSPSLIRPAGGDRYEYLILPVRLSTISA
ncbi:MAG: DNA polymerase III subunit beta [Clostridiales Family XIII bacterium]|jgi:DNA polymerase-3 subunit beta|nr:DNA polymerase III subunit beta [Clostridiales Family XIII bacterium]